MGKKKRRINFHKKLYLKRGIIETIKAFSKIAEAKITEKGDYYSVDISTKEEIVKNEIAYEFSNFALYKTIEMRK